MTVKASSSVPPTLRFGVFEFDPKAGELRKKGMKIRLQGQPVDILVMLLQRPGETVTREELQKSLWPADTFVDFEQGLNNAMKRLRAALDDDAESPHFIETLPRRGYRFIAPVDGASPTVPAEVPASNTPLPQRSQALRLSILFGTCLLLAVLGFVIYLRRQVSKPPVQRALTRLTFDDGLQIGATWSPDGRFIAYSSDRGGKFDIWVQQVSGGDPVQITKGPGQNWQPDWSPDGKYIAYRSEEGEGGLYIVPALGGAGQERKIASFGYFPKWSPDSSQILLQTSGYGAGLSCHFYVLGLDGSPPRAVQADLTERMEAVSAAWHPDGKRISIRTWDMRPSAVPVFWTASITGGTPIKTEVGPEILKAAQGVAGSGFNAWADPDSKFSWAPSGSAIYFERTFRGARNIWRLKLDPQTLSALALDRLTTGAGVETDLSLTPDGSKLAFVNKSRRVQAWMFPFDATRGRVTGAGKAITSPGMEAWTTSLSQDGRRLAFLARRSGQSGIWQTTVQDGTEIPVAADDSYVRNEPQWSPDGSRLAYVRMKPSTGEVQAVIWSKQQGEQPVTAPSRDAVLLVFDWSRDANWLLASIAETESAQSEIWLLPAAGVEAQAKARRIIACDAKTNLWQSRFSPNGRWIVFEAEEIKPITPESRIYVADATGGAPWIRITEGKHWDDKPRWSPDGRTIYYVSERKGFFNVWGIHFDPVRGKAEGEPFQVTRFENPRFMIADVMMTVGLSVTQDKLAITVEEQSGSIWMLDNVDK